MRGGYGWYYARTGMAVPVRTGILDSRLDSSPTGSRLTAPPQAFQNWTFRDGNALGSLTALVRGWRGESIRPTLTGFAFGLQYAFTAMSADVPTSEPRRRITLGGELRPAESSNLPQGRR